MRNVPGHVHSCSLVETKYCLYIRQPPTYIQIDRHVINQLSQRHLFVVESTIPV